MNEKEFYKQEIVRMVQSMSNHRFLESIYFFVKTMYEKGVSE
jgi:hypothetical protein